MKTPGLMWLREGRWTTFLNTTHFKMFSCLGPVRVGEDDGEVLGQAGADHRVQVVGGELEEARGDLVHLDQTLLVKQLDTLLLRRLLQTIFNNHSHNVDSINVL